MRVIISRFGAFVFAAVGFSTYATPPIAQFSATEQVGLDWPRTLVTYPLAERQLPTPKSEMRLVDINGVEQPFQLSPTGRISFFASLPATVRSNGVMQTSRYQYELRAEKPLVPVKTSLRVVPEGESLVLLNNLVAIRLPKPGETKVDKPLTEAPAPIRGVRLLDGRWTGRSYFFAAETNNQPQVTGYTCEITEEGPLFVEARVRYTFAGTEKYELTARVLDGDPSVRIDEQYDLGNSGNMWQYRLIVPLTGPGWKPDVAYGFAVQNFVSGTAPAYAAKLEELGVTNNVGFSIPIKFDEPQRKIFDVAARYPWWPAAQFFGLVNTAEMTKEAAQRHRLPFLGVAPMHPGNWRGSISSHDAMLFSDNNGEVQLNWPLVVPAHPRTLLHTGEYDPSLPLTFGRRQWAILGGSFQTARQLSDFRGYEGFVNLDDYKDWILDWPADTNVAYPRLALSRADVERARPRFNDLPEAKTFEKFLYFRDTVARRQELWELLRSRSEWSSAVGLIQRIRTTSLEGETPMNWAVHYRLSQMAGGWIHNADEFLSSDQIPPAQRAQLRSELAALCSLLTEPDVNPRGSMTHLGNPNMPVNRFCALPWAASLIPDHPQAKTWLDLSAQYIRYKLAMNTAPGGAWSELMTYYNASAPLLIQTAAVLAKQGRLSNATAKLAGQAALFPTHLLTPRDPRFGVRIVPGWGHEGIDNMTHFLVAAGVMRRIDPAVAQALIWSWDQNGQPMRGPFDAGFNSRVQVYAALRDTLPRGYLPPQLQSSWLPGFGATMRAHAGDPNETYLSLRNGYMCSHSDANQGDFVLYSKGAPLVTLSLGPYCLNEATPAGTLYRQFGWHNRPRFGTQQNDSGWPGGGARGGVPAHAFTDSTDYLRAVGDYGPNRWTRQIALLKGKSAAGPNYFVFRDSFDAVNGDPTTREQTWWSLRTLGPKDQLQVAGNELVRTSAFGGVKLVAHFFQPPSLTAESRDVQTQSTLYYENARTWMRAGSPVVVTNHADNLVVQETMTVTSVGPLPPGQDVMVALYPQAKDETAPTYESLGDGAAKITTSEGTDYVFLDRKPMQFSGGDVAFEGIAGAVRVYPNEVHLILSEGPGTVTYQGATLKSVEPAIKIIKPGQKGVFDIPGRKSKLKNTTLPPGCSISGDGVCELKIESDRITGKSDSRGAFLYVPMPPGMKVLPTLVIDGQTYAPGTTGSELIIPLMPGEQSFEVRALEQPPIFRNWQAW